MKIDQIIIKPVLTEKATAQVKRGVYTFIVNIRATKLQIKTAIEKLFPVTVDKISIINRRGKTRRSGRRLTVKRLPGKKIAVIKMKTGKIDLFPSE